MKRNLLFTVAFLTLLTFAVSTFAMSFGDDFIGYRHKGVLRGETLPNGARDLGGGLLSNENYGVTRFAKGKKYMLWFEKIVDHNSEGVPLWEVKDVLTFEKPKKNQEFFFSYSSPCRQNRKVNLDLIVLAERLPRQKSYKVISAWRANVRKERFEAVPTKGIVCSQGK
jgi:hypothetical protein